jgi:7-cyano-7-deazaguanine synthase
MSKAIVLFSGGQDSTTILGMALANGYEVLALGFDYGQRHLVELLQAKKIAAKLNVPYEILNLRALGSMVSSALTNETDAVADPHSRMTGVPNSFVPNRNALLLTFAHAYAQEKGADTVIGGMCQTDYSGYPDCRQQFIVALENALNIGYQTNIHFATPLMYLNKAETFAAAKEAGVLDEVLTMSHTCYEGDRQLSHEWGAGCGECPACKLRANGWEQYKAGETV